MPDIFTNEKPEVTPASKTKADAAAHTHAFASFCEHPKGVWLQNQQENESVLLILRRHFVTNIPWILTVLFFLVIPLGILFLLQLQPQSFTTAFLPQRFITVLLTLYYLVVFGYALVNFITWFYNVSLVTTLRVVDVDYSDIVYHNVAATKITLIQDVDYTQSGFIRTFFNYGDVFVQTASESPNFDFLAVPKPTRVVHILEDLIGKKPYVP